MKGSVIFSGLVPFNHIVFGCSGEELASHEDGVGDHPCENEGVMIAVFSFVGVMYQPTNSMVDS